nr:EOG090X0DPU [Eurycercus lamellatus]
MVVKFYISMISGNKEMKKRQMKAQLIMESKGVDFKVIDIADPSSEQERHFMQKNATAKNGARNPVPPQFFNEELYCGDYEGFDDANENDQLEEFLKLPKGSLPQVSLEKEIITPQLNGTPVQTKPLEPTNGKQEDEEEEEEEEDEETEEEEEAGFHNISCLKFSTVKFSPRDWD